MYLDFLVKVPTVKGKITRRKKSNVVYIEYEYDRVYDPSRKYTFPKRVTIGKLSDTDLELMRPNQNFLKYFPDAELPECKNTIPGMPPTLIDPPKGDAFACRNEYALNIDYEEMPPMFKITDTHYAATWLLDPRAPQIKSPMGGTAHE